MAEDDDYRNIFGEGTFQVATPSIASLPKVIDEQRLDNNRSILH